MASNQSALPAALPSIRLSVSHLTIVAGINHRRFFLRRAQLYRLKLTSCRRRQISLFLFSYIREASRYWISAPRKSTDKKRSA